ncbi:MAG: hypothetical protein R6X02_06995 [Enhygromyxa sp.]
MSTEAQHFRELRTWAKRHQPHFERGPGHGLGCPHRYLRASGDVLPTSARAACEALIDPASADSELAAVWLHIVPTGGFILPCQPVLEWGPSTGGPGERLEELVLAVAVDGPDGATHLLSGSPRREPEQAGHRLTVHSDSWYWVSPVLGPERISLVWIMR